ncbi:MAG: CRTAC1 family protein [Acidobacteriota bacterium]|nr:MAG: CRTAC1 family protein [Acidobacteriota bacterium]
MRQIVTLAIVLLWPAWALAESRLTFTDVTSEAGIQFTHENGASEEKLLVETFGSGVAWIDYDDDGLLDLYFANGANLYTKAESPGNSLLKNNGDGTFSDVTTSAGVKGLGGFATGVAVGDYDNDGDQDLFICYYGPNQLFRNNGNGTFTDVTSQAGVAGNLWSSSAGFFDYDRDGDLDLFVVDYLDYDLANNPYCGLRKEGYRAYCDPRIFDGTADQLFQNNGDGTFTDVSEDAGISNPIGKGLGITFGDFDLDGYVDAYVANDLVRNFLYNNAGDGGFIDITYGAGVGYDLNGKPQAGMGTDFGDFDGDGLLDIFVTNFSEEFNTLYRNRGEQEFEDVSEEVGLGSGFLPLGFGTKFLDFDNDGDLDIYITNGHIADNVSLMNPSLSYAQTDLLYENVGGKFQDISASSGSVFQQKHVGRGAAVADYDNDGDQDIVIANCGGRPILLRNDIGNRQNWLLIALQGKQSNSHGYGTKIRLTSNQQLQYKEANPVASYLSSNDTRVHFGLGEATSVESIEIEWLSGKKSVLKDVKANQILVVEE